MTKSFLEIAREIAELVESEGDGRLLSGWESDDDGELDHVEIRLSREIELRIEAILRREFGDNDGPALERKSDSTQTIAAKIDSKQYIVL